MRGYRHSLTSIQCTDVPHISQIWHCRHRGGSHITWDRIVASQSEVQPLTHDLLTKQPDFAYWNVILVVGILVVFVTARTFLKLTFSYVNGKRQKSDYEKARAPPA